MRDATDWIQDVPYLELGGRGAATPLPQTSVRCVRWSARARCGAGSRCRAVAPPGAVRPWGRRTATP
ncbi:hypothetical protein [Streptomyces murinus]